MTALAAGARAQTTLSSEDFESGYPRRKMTDLWNQQDAGEPCTQVAVPFPSGMHCAWFGSDATCNFVLWSWDFQYVACTDSITLPATTDTLELRLCSFSDGEDDGVWDTLIGPPGSCTPSSSTRCCSGTRS